MKTIKLGIVALSCALLAACLSAQKPASAEVAVGQAGGLVVGTYDSRAIAVAYVASDAFREKMRKLYAELAEAKKKGDEELVASLEALGPAMQAEIHKQGFGTAPVGNILAGMEQQLSEIASTAAVDLIVSKWTLDYQSESARFVDVTSFLVAEFEPSKKTLKTIKELRRRSPVPASDLENH
ncbi:MAG: hypothetical protein GY930_00485 [bacterium]|nr:hypothetical protein [bacterium]